MSAVKPHTLGPGAYCVASSLTSYGEKLDTLAAGMLPSLLGIPPASDGLPGSITRETLLNAIASPLRADALQTIAVVLPQDLFGDDIVTRWASRLVAVCDHVYQQRGSHAYIECMTDLIFDEGNDKAGLPGSLRDGCAMLVKNALEAGLAHQLDRAALQGLRNTVITRFLIGSVFVPHLRPQAMREATDDSRLYAFDRQLFKRFCQKTADVLDIDAEAMVLLAVSRQRTSGSQS